MTVDPLARYEHQSLTLFETPRQAPWSVTDQGNGEQCRIHPPLSVRVQIISATVGWLFVSDLIISKAFIKSSQRGFRCWQPSTIDFHSRLRFGDTNFYHGAPPLHCHARPHVKSAQGKGECLADVHGCHGNWPGGFRFAATRGWKSPIHSHIHSDRNALSFPLSVSNTLFLVPGKAILPLTVE